MDVAFVVDTTGSMRDDIGAVKDNLFKIVKEVTSHTKGLTIRFGIVSYRDHPPQDDTYVTRVFDFSGDVHKVHKEISQLDASEGGDIPEAVADGLFDARTKLSWDKSAYKVLLLVGDAPPHGRQYNDIAEDAWPKGCPDGHDPREEVMALKKKYGNAFFLFVCGCHPLVERAFRSIADAVDGGQYLSLSEAHELPAAILKILEGVGDLIAIDQQVYSYYQTHDGVFELGEAASALGIELRELKTSLSRLFELGKIAHWPRGRPLSPLQHGITVELGPIPDAIIPGKSFKYSLRVRNPSSAAIGIRVVMTLMTDEGVSEVTNEQHEISPQTDSSIELLLVPMCEARGRASIKVDVLYGSRALASKTYQTRLYPVEERP